MNQFGWMSRVRVLLLVVAAGGVPLLTVGSCDPFTGSLDIYRDDDYGDRYWPGGFYIDGGYYYEDYYYDDCFDCYYEEEIIFYP
jgi:hypothetical protein